MAHPHRIAVLRSIKQDYALTTVATPLELSRSGVQTHLDTLIDTNLGLRIGDQQEPYCLTALDDLALQLVEQVQQPAQAIEDARQTAADQAEDELGDAPLPDAERERAINCRTWELVADTLADEDWTRFEP